MTGSIGIVGYVELERRLASCRGFLRRGVSIEREKFRRQRSPFLVAFEPNSRRLCWTWKVKEFRALAGYYFCRECVYFLVDHI